MNSEKELAYKRAILENSFLDFVRYFFKKSTGVSFILNWHHEEICKTLERVFYGEITKLIINVPPGYGKTNLMELFAAWCFAKVSRSKFIYTSYSDALVQNCSSNIRGIIRSQEFQELWPVAISTDTDSKKLWKTVNKGAFYAVSMGGGVTGFHAGTFQEGFGGALLMDDPIKAKNIHSPVYRENCILDYTGTLLSRLTTPKTPIVLIMQRLHEGDLTGYILEHEQGWHHLKLPVITDEKPLWEFKHSLEHIEKLKKQNKKVFSGQYMQEPAPLEGDIFKEKDFRFYKELPEQFDHIVQSWDTAFKKGAENDYSVCGTWGMKKNQFGYDHYLINVFRGKLEYPQLRLKFIELQKKYNPYQILIEDKASGQSLLQDLKQAGNNKLKPIKVDSDKESRAVAPCNMVASGCVFLPEESNWVSDYIYEMLMFPNGVHDDTVDMTTQYLNWCNKPKRTVWAYTV